jgi:small subunit ribosomal protein S17
VNEKVEKIQRKLRCIVTSDKMMKSRTAKFERLVQEARTKKFIKRTTKIMFHDETNQSKAGDTVLIVQTRPKSANKTFALHSIVVTAKD